MKFTVCIMQDDVEHPGWEACVKSRQGVDLKDLEQACADMQMEARRMARNTLDEHFYYLEVRPILPTVRGEVRHWSHREED